MIYKWVLYSVTVYTVPDWFVTGWLVIGPFRHQDVSVTEYRTWIGCSVNICCLITEISDFMFSEHAGMWNKNECMQTCITGTQPSLSWTHLLQGVTPLFEPVSERLSVNYCIESTDLTVHSRPQFSLCCPVWKFDLQHS